MQFDEGGYLVPHEILITDLQAFERLFVDNFENSETRKLIFNTYLEYLEKLKNIVGHGFCQWINGSFVTQKLNPNDIDILTLLNHDVYQNNELELRDLRQKMLKKQIDSYFLKVYPQHHNAHFLYENDIMQWKFQFGFHTRTRKNKGFIQINFD